MKRTLLWLLASCCILSASAQIPEPSKTDGRVESSVSNDDDLYSMPDISKWMPIEKFAEEMQADPQMQPRSTFSTRMVIPKPRQKTVVVSPDNSTVKFGRHFSISNGNAGNWGSGPGAYLDARTLSFPTPRKVNGGR